MITSKKELKEYIKADQKALGMKYPILAKFTYGEQSRIRHFLIVLRKTEFYSTSQKVFGKFVYRYFLFRLRRLNIKYNIFIYPNTIGKGLHIVHPGFIRIGKYCNIGENCTILPMVLIGKKNPGTDCKITIGDNCYISTGVTILGPVTIGNNVTIAAGAVVLHDIPNNVVVAGVPAKIVKYNSGGVNSDKVFCLSLIFGKIA